MKVPARPRSTPLDPVVVAGDELAAGAWSCCATTASAAGRATC